MIARIYVNMMPHYKGICDGCMKWMPGKGEEPDDILNLMKKNGWKVTREGNHYCEQCKRLSEPTEQRPGAD